MMDTFLNREKGRKKGHYQSTSIVYVYPLLHSEKLSKLSSNLCLAVKLHRYIIMVQSYLRRSWNFDEWPKKPNLQTEQRRSKVLERKITDHFPASPHTKKNFNKFIYIPQPWWNWIPVNLNWLNTVSGLIMCT